MDDKKPTALINATAIDGCNILVFDGVEFAKTVAEKSKELFKLDKDLAMEFLKTMNGISMSMENCTASFDNSNHYHYKGEQDEEN